MSDLPALPAFGPIPRPAAHGASLAVTSPPPRILIVAPEIARVPSGLSPRASQFLGKAGGLADVTASLAAGLEAQGAEVHLALPNYRRLFGSDADASFKDSLAEAALPDGDRRVHLAEDRAFYYRTHIYGGPEAPAAVTAFQREVMNNIIREVRPDLIHCHDWTTGLVPAFARRHGIPCVFTVHNIHTESWNLAYLEERGIDAASFWEHLYFNNPPHNYEETRAGNSCDLLASGILAADLVNVVSPNFLTEILDGYHDFVPGAVRHVLRMKAESGQARGILNAPDISYDPATDPELFCNYGSRDVVDGKSWNKGALQKRLGLEIDPEAPVLFWPSRLDPLQKGCDLFASVLHGIISDYHHLGLQVVAVADGEAQGHIRHIIHHHGFQSRAACVDFDEGLSRCGFAAADFVLMPSRFEPCGLPQMIGARYGALPIARNTGGIHDTVRELDCDAHCGNGFRFDTYDAGGFRWAIDRALSFFQGPAERREAEIRRVMDEAAGDFSDETMVEAYSGLYEELLQRPLTPPEQGPAGTLTAPFPVPRLAAAPERHSSGAPVLTGAQRG
ncbi:MAG: glycosyltransferase [Akkermansiaceae bacterium]|nr:glycosyltransferase [Akkermansiaceae bacterium]